MSAVIVLRQALLYGHILFFALAIAAVAKEDFRLLRGACLDVAGLASTATAVSWLLAGLWATGVPMVMMETGTDLALLLDRPKLLTKVVVVAALTLNGVLLHAVVFPMLHGRPDRPRRVAAIAAVLGAVSTSSWLYASFIGVARLVAPYLALRHFLALYGVCTAVAVAFALLFLRQRIERMIRSSETPAIVREPAAAGALQIPAGAIG